MITTTTIVKRCIDVVLSIPIEIIEYENLRDRMGCIKGYLI